MNFSQALDLTFVASIVLFTWIIVNGLVQAAIACWKSTAPVKPSKLNPETPIAYHYACPLTCELPQVPTAPTEAPEAEALVEAIATPAVSEIEEVQETVSTAPEKGKKLTLAQQVKARCCQVFGYEIKTPADAKRAIINKSDVSFMGAVNLERKGADFWMAVNAQLDRIELERQNKKAA